MTLLSKRVILLFVGMLLLGRLYGQRDVKDSLTTLLKTDLSSVQRVDALTELSYQYYDFNDSLALSYARSALELALQIDYKKGVKYAYTLVGLGYSSRSEYRTAIANYRQSDRIKIKKDEIGNAPYNLVLMGNLYRDIAMFDSALFMYRQAKAINAKDDYSNLSNIYKNMASVLIVLWKNEKALEYLDSATQALNPRQKWNAYVKMDIMSLYGQAYQNLLEFDKSAQSYDEMCKDAFELDDYYHQISCKLNHAHLAYNQGDFPEALRICFEGLQLTKRYNFPPQYVKLLLQIGEVYIALSQFDIASQYLFQALRLSERLGLDFQTGEIYAELAWVSKEQRNYQPGLEYVDKSQAIRERIGDRKGVANCHNVRGLIFFLQKEYTKSLSEHDKALKIRESIGHLEGISASIFNISLVYEEQNQIDRALELQERALEMESKINNKQSIAISFNALSALLIKSDRLKEAKAYLDKAALLGQVTNSRMLKRNTALNYVDYYVAIKDYQQALYYQKQYQMLDDSIFSESRAIKLAEAEALYNVEKNERQIEILNQRQRIQEDQIMLQQSQLAQQTTIIIAVIVGLIMLTTASFIGYQYYREKSKSHEQLVKLNAEIKEQKEEIQAQSEELIEANQTIAEINKGLEKKVETRTMELKQAYTELDTFFYRSSHDFRRPLTTFMGLAEVSKITVKDKYALELFDKVRETAHNLDKMLLKLQSISDVGSQQMVYKEVPLKEMFNDLLDDWRPVLAKSNIQTFVEVDLGQPFVSYPAMIRIVAENLIENSIQFCGVANSYIKISASRQGGQVRLVVEDNGQGIDAAYQDRVFEMYFRASQNSKGNGLGLYIVKKAVEKLKGTISLISKPDVGSTFTILLPLEQKFGEFVG